MECTICTALRPPEDREPVSAPDSRACLPHLFQVADLLVAIPRLMSYLSESDTLITTRDTDTERWVGSKAPVDTTALCALDRRTKAARRGDPISGERVLRAWLYAILDLPTIGPGYWAHDDPMPRFPVGFICTLLITHLPTVAATDAFPRFAQHVAAVYDSLKRLAPAW